jgi:hypothetical protein
MDYANVLLTVVLSGIAVVAAVLKGVTYTMRRLLIDEGLIRPGKPGVTHWPNGYHNLPDTLEGIHAEMRSHHAKDSH